MSAPALAGLTAHGQLERILELARRHLDIDAVLVSEFTGGRQVFRALAGDSASFGLHLDGGPLLEATYCARVVDGQLPNLIPDTSLEPGVADLDATASIGAYAGVPLRLADGSVYGTFCCLSHTPDRTLGERDLRFLEMLAELIVAGLEQERHERQRRDAITGLIRSGGLVIALQPIVSLVDGRCLGLEALSRFADPFSRPDVIFAEANDLGLGLDLERLAIQRALEVVPQLAAGQALCINASPGAALAFARGELIPGPLPLDRLVLEITEHASIDSYRELREVMAPLRAAGMRIAIDDAGAGYASLHHIVELAPDVIKVDRSLVDGIAHDRARRSAVGSLVLLALELGAMTVAEGVESHDDLRALCDLGFDAAQGYLLARPSTASADLREWTCASQGDLLGVGTGAVPGPRSRLAGRGSNPL